VARCEEVRVCRRAGRAAGAVMRFSRHLSSHLTPEWRKKYIQYTELKRMLYEMIGTKKTLLGSWPQNRGEMCYTHHPLDTRKAVARQILISH
jgi:hypothetical protein